MDTKIQAVIFDLDGTVLDNEGDWEEVFGKVIASNGLKVSGDLRQANGWIHEPGVGLETNWKRLLGNDHTDDVRKWSNLTREEYQKEFGGGGVLVREGLVDLVLKLKELKIQTALATSTYWYVVESELEELSLQLAFDVTTTAEEVSMPKPDPEIYMLTAQKLGVEPGNCLVVEDSIGGVRSAVEAGMSVVGLESAYSTSKMLKAAGANWTVQDLRNVEKTVDLEQENEN